MDALLKVQLKPDRERSAQEAVDLLRRGFAEDPRFEEILRQCYQEGLSDPTPEDRLPPSTPPFTRERLEFAFDAGGMIRSAMNEGRSTPINVQITGKDLQKAHRVAEAMLAEVRGVEGVVDARILQRVDYPQYVLEVDQSKASSSGLT